MDGSCRVLLVEDDLEQADRIKTNLLKTNPNLVIDTVLPQPEQLARHVGENGGDYEVIIIDSDGDETKVKLLSQIQSRHGDTPVVVVSEQEVDLELQARLNGERYDYLRKDPDYVRKLPRVVQQNLERRQRKGAGRRRTDTTWQQLLDGAEEMILQVSRDLQVVRANRRFAEAFELEPESVLGKTCCEILCRNGRCGHEPCAVKETISQRRSLKHEHVIAERTYALRTQPLFTPTGELDSVAVYLRDLSEQKRFEDSLLLSEKLATVGLLASGIAHDIRNPLNVIETARYYLEEFLVDQSDEVLDKLAIIHNNVRRASNIIQNLLEYTRASKYDTEVINVTKLVQNTVALIGKELTAKNIELHFDPSQTHYACFNIDSLKQVLLNIVINAIQAMPRGGALSIEVTQSDETVDIYVTDTGVGIPKEHLARIFEPFFTTKEPGVGTGLGLYLTKLILDRDRGRIQVRSQPGKGTTFVLSLPRATSDVGADAQD